MQNSKDKKISYIINTDGDVERKLYFKNISGILLLKMFHNACKFYMLELFCLE